MCGRIEYFITSRKQLEGRYHATMVEGYTEQGVVNARYNVSPSTTTPVLTSEDSDSIVLGHWGFVPSWSKGKQKEVINARAETILEKPYFKGDIRKHRCLIPVTGFFEWHREAGTSTPYRFYTDDEIFSLAGIYSVQNDKTGNTRPHFAIVTTTANSVMAPVHDRMPVIVDTKDEEHWLTADTDEAIAHLLRSYPAKHTHAYKISTLVNNPRNDIPDVRKPVP